MKLPLAKKAVEQDLGKYILLMYGREKIGKTTFFSSFPRSIFFCTEPGSKALSVFELNADDGGVKDWNIFREGVDLLCKQGIKRFNTVIIDTVDRAYDFCLDWVCKERGIEYPGVDVSGEQDYGKSWRAVRQEFLEQIHKLLRAGIGICFTSHAKEEAIKTKSGERFTRIFPSMSNQARNVVEAIVDMFFYAEYFKDIQTQEVKRILITQGDDTIWAGCRVDKIPRFIPLVKENGYELLRQAFIGEHKGLNLDSFMTAKTTTKTGAEFLTKVRRLTIRKGGETQTPNVLKKVVR